MDVAFVVQIVEAVCEIDRQLAMANRLLMFTQPARPNARPLIFNNLLDRSALADCGLSIPRLSGLQALSQCRRVAKRRHLARYTDDMGHPSAGTGLRRDRLGRGCQARFLVGLDVDLTASWFWLRLTTSILDSFRVSWQESM